MKGIILGILREIGIALIIIVVLLGVTVLVFKDQLPYDEVIPKGEQYVGVNLKTYSVSSTDRISEVNAITITHEANQGQIISAENEVRIQTGKYTPFGTIDGGSDLPTERVGMRAPTTSDSSTSRNTSNNSEATDTTAEGTDTSSTTGEQTGEKLDYPESGSMINEIEKDQSESSEDAANRRFNNAD